MSMMDWSALSAGDLVLGKDSHTWKITKIATADPAGKIPVTLERDGRRPFTTRVSGQVQAVWTQAQDLERAQALLQVQLGAETVGRKGPNGVFLAPAAFAHPGSLLAHAYLFHGETGDGTASLEALRRWHDELHLKADGTPHHHDPDFYKANR